MGGGSVATVRFGFFSVFRRLFRYRECSNRYDNTNNDGKHCPTSYLSYKKRFIQIHAANLEILKEQQAAFLHGSKMVDKLLSHLSD